MRESHRHALAAVWGQGAGVEPVLRRAGPGCISCRAPGSSPRVVRWFPPGRPLERVAGDAEVLRAVRHLDVEQLVETVDGRVFTECGGRGMIVTRFIDGASSPRDRASLRRVAATLATTGQVEVAAGSRVARRAGSLPAEDLAAARQWLDEVAGDVPPDIRAMFSRLRHDVEKTSESRRRPSGLYIPIVMSPTSLAHQAVPCCSTGRAPESARWSQRLAGCCSHRR